MAIIKETYGADKNILIAPELAFTIGCIVSDTGAGVVATDDGRKIIKAGTPVGGATNVLENRQTVLETDGTAQGVILHDVDVTEGNNNATLVVAGYVDLLKLEDSVLALVETAKGNLPKITFMKGAK